MGVRICRCLAVLCFAVIVFFAVSVLEYKGITLTSFSNIENAPAMVGAVSDVGISDYQSVNKSNIANNLYVPAAVGAVSDGTISVMSGFKKYENSYSCGASGGTVIVTPSIEPFSFQVLSLNAVTVKANNYSFSSLSAKDVHTVTCSKSDGETVLAVDGKEMHIAALQFELKFYSYATVGEVVTIVRETYHDLPIPLDAADGAKVLFPSIASNELSPAPLNTREDTTLTAIVLDANKRVSCLRVINRYKKQLRLEISADSFELPSGIGGVLTKDDGIEISDNIAKFKDSGVYVITAALGCYVTELELNVSLLSEETPPDSSDTDGSADKPDIPSGGDEITPPTDGNDNSQDNMRPDIPNGETDKPSNGNNGAQDNPEGIEPPNSGSDGNQNNPDDATNNGNNDSQNNTKPDLPNTDEENSHGNGTDTAPEIPDAGGESNTTNPDSPETESGNQSDGIVEPPNDGSEDLTVNLDGAISPDVGKIIGVTVGCALVLGGVSAAIFIAVQIRKRKKNNRNNI